MDLFRFLSGLGIATASFYTLKLLRFVRFYLRSSMLHLYLRKNSSWALVTGASDGIGLGFAQELARSGFNVVLHGRNTRKLEKVKEQLQQEYPDVQYRVIALDASSSSHSQISDVVGSLDDLHLTVLINNVGGAVRVSPLELHTAEETDSIINANARFPTQLTRALLPKLTKPPGPTLIMNVGSLADFLIPYAVTYGGSKAFNTAWSSSLAVEMRAEGKNVEVLAVSVGKVTDVSHNKESVTFFTPSGRTMAKAALRRVGCGEPVIVGYIGHAMQKFMLDVLPAGVFERMVIPRMQGLWEQERRKQ